MSVEAPDVCMSPEADAPGVGQSNAGPNQSFAAGTDGPNQARSVSAVTHTILRELADECVCPISQSLMVDPVLASDSHTYDRPQIEAWFRRQQADRQVPTSPQTREPMPDMRLISNGAVKRTIERLINSGRLDAQIISEWQAAKEAIDKSASTAKREKSLACAPIGTKVMVDVLVTPRQDETADAEMVSGTRSLRDMMVDLYAPDGVQSAGFFGAPPARAARLLVANVSLTAAMRCLEQPIPQRIKALLEVPASTPSSPVSPDELIASILPDNSNVSGCSSCAQVELLEGKVLALEHIVRRLASTENGLPAAIQSDWEVLDKELLRRSRVFKLKELKALLGSSPLSMVSVVRAVDEIGSFTIAFTGEASTGAEAAPEAITATVPGNFIGTGGVAATRRAGGIMSQATMMGQFPGGGMFGNDMPFNMPTDRGAMASGDAGIDENSDAAVVQRVVTQQVVVGEGPGGGTQPGQGMMVPPGIQFVQGGPTGIVGMMMMTPGDAEAFLEHLPPMQGGGAGPQQIFQQDDWMMAGPNIPGMPGMGGYPMGPGMTSLSGMAPGMMPGMMVPGGMGMMQQGGMSMGLPAGMAAMLTGQGTPGATPGMPGMAMMGPTMPSDHPPL